METRKGHKHANQTGARSLSSDEMERLPAVATATARSTQHKSGGGGGSPPAGNSYRPRVSALGRTPACPAFFSSPKPDALPMPSFSFINKAGATSIAPRMCAAA
jgi:hypothetical protein